MRRIEIKHTENFAEIRSATGELSKNPITVKAAESNEVIKKAIDIVRKRFLRKGKSLTIHISPVNPDQ